MVVVAFFLGVVFLAGVGVLRGVVFPVLRGVRGVLRVVAFFFAGVRGVVAFFAGVEYFFTAILECGVDVVLRVDVGVSALKKFQSGVHPCCRVLRVWYCVWYCVSLPLTFL